LENVEVNVLQEHRRNEKAILQSLLTKIILYRFTRNFDKILQNQRISHAELSAATGRASNWFNRTYNELEDMRVSTFIKSMAAVNKILSQRGNDNQINPLDSIFDQELLRIASVFLDLSLFEPQELLDSDESMTAFFIGLKVYVDALKGMDAAVSPEEIAIFEKLLSKVREG
jgi:hypothetical protein